MSEAFQENLNEFVINFIDGDLVSSKSLGEHEQGVSSFGGSCKGKSCLLGWVSAVSGKGNGLFQGLTVSAGGVSVDPVKMQSS